MGPSRPIRACMTMVAAAFAGFTLLSAQPTAFSLDQQRAPQLLDALAKALPSSAQREISWLVDSVRRRPLASLPANVIVGLEADLAALNRVSEVPPAERDRVVEVVREDIRLKAQYCRSHPDGMAAQIALTVRTWQQGQARTESPQWQVVYINAPWAGFAGRKPSPFPKFSSPTSMSLAPGAYVLWAQDPATATRRGPEIVVRLGLGSSAAVEADLLVAPGG